MSTAKQKQQELGLTGTFSRNYEFVDPIMNQLSEKFVHDHGNETVNDCILAVVRMRMGEKPGTKDGYATGGVLAVGCNHDMLECFKMIFEQDPQLMHVAVMAAMEVQHEGIAKERKQQRDN